MKPSAIHNNVGQCSNIIQLIYLSLLLQVQLRGVQGDGLTTLSNASSRDASRNITRILNEFFSSGYDKRVRPNYGGAPVEVGISMFIISISTVSEVKMAYFHTATTPNRFLRISSDGDVFQSIKLTVTASCPMDLQYFPMDRQSCSIDGYSMADIRYTWSKGKDSVGLSKGLELPQFKVVGHKQEQKEVTLSTGNYSRLICDIQFARSLGFYLIQIYIPASIIVVISFVSFWLHRNATPARVALGVTTVLTMTTLMSSTNAQLPKISYIKSIDVFLGTCFVMVFGSLLEYAVVGYLGKRISMRKQTAEQMSKQNDEHRKRCVAAQVANACVQDPQNQILADSGGSQQIATQLHQMNQGQQMPNQLQPHMTHLHVHSQPMQAIQHTQSIQPNQLCTQICQTTGLPLDPIQMACPLKTPIHHQQQMNTNAMNSLNTMNSMGMNRCTGTQSKIIYGPANFRVLDPSTQLQSQVHQAQNPHQLPTQAITKITNTKSDLPQMNKDASDNQPNISLSQQPRSYGEPTAADYDDPILSKSRFEQNIGHESI